ncbi:MAG TPA: FAD-dependent monooxygenase, partial [Candidatus Limnocylindria bacterium]|nr:FAD-dependent monooxygenase [Candidatus Limnocylindria bacterium]
MPALDAQVAVVGAGPIGMTVAGRLAQHGLSVILLEANPEPTGEGSKALCMQRETLEIWDRLGIGEHVAQRGIQWDVGRTYFRDRELFSVHLPGSGDDHFPPFVNINQTEVEAILRRRLSQLPKVEQRWGQRLTGLQQDGAAVTLTCDGAQGPSTIRTAFAVGTDGAHSSVRHLLGMGFPGHSHEDLFLICDIRASLPFPRERRFFFDPPWNPGRQVLVHPQPDGVWRIDWQVPSGTDVEAERASGLLDRRIRQVVGATTPYDLVWVTAYRFHQRLAPRFRVGRVLLAGDAAHLMSPFGARGLNSGAADAENVAWKLALVLRGQAPERLLDSYDAERRAAARENLAITDGSMRFMVPHGPLRRMARNAILRGSIRFAALRRLVNSGRLSQPYTYDASPVVAPPHDDERLPRHGALAPDARCTSLGREKGIARLRDLVGTDFLLLLVCRTTPERAAEIAIRATGLAWPAPCRVAVVGADRPLRGVSVLRDDVGELVGAYGAAGSRAWLIRPDGHLAGSLALPARESVDRLPRLQAMAIGDAGSALGGQPAVDPQRPARSSLPVAGVRRRLR